MQLEAAKKFILKKLSAELPAELTYHCVQHSIDVYNAASDIADAEGLKGEEKQLLLTAAVFHDSGFLVEMKNHEMHSCEFAKKYLPDFGYTQEQIKKVCSMIMATRLPQKPHTLPEKIIADADLDYLGSDKFIKIGKNLFKEFLYHGIVKDEKEWDDLQLNFLNAHKYFTETSNRIRAAKKSENLHKLKSKINNA